LQDQIRQAMSQHLVFELNQEVRLLKQLVRLLELKQLVAQILLEIVQLDHLPKEIQKLEVLILGDLKLGEVLEVVLQEAAALEVRLDLQEAVALEVHLDLQEAVAQEVVDQVDQEVVVLEVLQEVVELEVVLEVVLNLNLQVALQEKKETKEHSIFRNTLE
jgi:aspartate carbamoyltransferase catalytic subunit